MKKICNSGIYGWPVVPKFSLRCQEIMICYDKLSALNIRLMGSCQKWWAAEPNVAHRGHILKDILNFVLNMC